MYVLLFYNLAATLEKNIVPFPLSPAKLIGDVLTNLQCAAGSTLAPMYRCCKHRKNSQNLITVASCLHFFAYWCNWQISTNMFISAASISVILVFKLSGH
jgi:hypothetical protein